MNPADELRDRIAHALEREDALNCGYDHGFVNRYGVDEETDTFVDAVLAALPAPALAVARQILGTTTTPCGPVPDSCGGEPCANHEREQAHAEGEHAFCADDCPPAPSVTDTQPGDELANQRAQLIDAMSGVSEERWSAGWMDGLEWRLHEEGGIWETVGRSIGWPVGDYHAWTWMSWDEAAALYAASAVTEEPGR